MWPIMIETLETGITSPALPTLAEIERRTEDLLAQPPTAARPTPEPPCQPNEPQHTLRSIFDEYALYGLAGEAVRTLAPHSEAQPEALLLELLAAFGNVIGPGPHCMVGPTRHALNLFVVLVGESSKARKGTSWNQIPSPHSGPPPITRPPSRRKKRPPNPRNSLGTKPSAHSAHI